MEPWFHCQVFNYLENLTLTGKKSIGHKKRALFLSKHFLADKYFASNAHYRM
jgi:hypothetical protein